MFVLMTNHWNHRNKPRKAAECADVQIIITDVCGPIKKHQDFKPLTTGQVNSLTCDVDNLSSTQITVNCSNYSNSTNTSAHAAIKTHW